MPFLLCILREQHRRAAGAPGPPGKAISLLPQGHGRNQQRGPVHLRDAHRVNGPNGPANPAAGMRTCCSQQRPDDPRGARVVKFLE
jgi:hypothetical protein